MIIKLTGGEIGKAELKPGRGFMMVKILKLDA